MFVLKSLQFILAGKHYSFCGKSLLSKIKQYPNLNSTKTQIYIGGTIGGLYGAKSGYDIANEPRNDHTFGDYAGTRVIFTGCGGIWGGIFGVAYGFSAPVSIPLSMMMAVGYYNKKGEK